MLYFFNIKWNFSAEGFLDDLRKNVSSARSDGIALVKNSIF